MTTKKDTKQEKNKGGKSLLFDTPEKLEKALNDYFDSITITELKYQLVKVGEDEEGKPITERTLLKTDKRQTHRHTGTGYGKSGSTHSRQGYQRKGV